MIGFVGGFLAFFGGLGFFIGRFGVGGTVVRLVFFLFGGGVVFFLEIRIFGRVFLAGFLGGSF